MNKKAAVVGGLVAALAVAYGGGTWWAGSKIQSGYAAALGELPKQTSMVRVVEHKYERSLFGAVSTMTLEIGCSAVAAAPTPEPGAGESEEEEEEDPAREAVTPPKPVRLTIRDTIHHGPFAGGTLAAAVIESELALDDIKSKADVERVFGKVKPVTARTRVAFDGAFATDLAIAPAKVSEQGQGEFVWQGLQAHVDMDATRTISRYEATLPGLDFNDTEKGVHLKLGKLTMKGNNDTSAGGWMIAAGKAEFGLDAFELAVDKGVDGSDPAATGKKPLPKIILERIAMTGEATIKDGLYATSGTLQGQGKIGETVLNKFEMVSSARRIEVAGYRKVADAWMQSMAGTGCGKAANKSQRAAMKKIVDQLAPDLKVMAKHGPELALDKLMIEIDGKRGQLGYSAALVGVTDEDLAADSQALLIKRGVVKVDARLPVKWLEQLAAVGADSGGTPPPEMVAGLIEQGQQMGLVVREGDDITSHAEFSEGNLKVNGKPFAGLGGPGDETVVK